MYDEARVGELLEEALESDSTPDQVCINDPELLPEVRRRWEDCRRMEVALEALFPSSVPSSNGEGGVTRPWAELPHVPGHEVEAVLGRGGVGVVYKARHVKLKRPVAIKMLLSGAYASRVELARFLQEARAVAALRHPHVVQVYDVGECDGLPFYTMELLEGGSLAERLGGNPQPARRASTMLVTLADAVHAAHQSGVIHRDLKPGNVLLTAEGLPKVSDFGLARPIETASEDDALTIGGGRIGTPSYMAPEQASGQHGTVGPATDVYALGAILYEMLTGRPPFRGENAADTERQLLNEEPVRPSRLNARVPRDLETIALKCLQKDPRRRYASAAELRDDLRRFEQNQPILARPAHVFERAGKWTRRHPALATAAVAALVLAMTFTMVLMRTRVQQAQLRSAIETDLNDVAELELQQNWTQARAPLLRATARLDNGAPADLRQRVGTVQRDLNLVDDLYAIHLRRNSSGGLPLYRQQAVHDYRAKFDEAGLTRPGEPLEKAVPRIIASPVRPALVAALDDWALSVIVDNPNEHELLDLVSRVDPDAAKDDPPRRLAAEPDSNDLADRIHGLDMTGASVSSLLVLGERLMLIGKNPREFLQRVQFEYPDDFWANLALGDVYMPQDPANASIYYRVALASRPGAAVGFLELGNALMGMGQIPDAIEYFDRALQRDPKLGRAECDLGRAYGKLNRQDESFACYQRALQMDPDYAWSHNELGWIYLSRHQLEDAVREFQYVVQASPMSPGAQYSYRSVLIQLGRTEQAWAEWKAGLAKHVLNGFDAWNGYAEMCLFLHHEDEYRRARTHLLQLFGDRSDPRVMEPIARAALLEPPSPAELQQATDLARRAELDDRGTDTHVYSAFALGLAEYRAGHDAAAIEWMREPIAAHHLGPCPCLIEAMAYQHQGNTAAAREGLWNAVINAEWEPTHAYPRDDFLYFILRREAEAMIWPDLPSVLAGKVVPSTNQERLSLLGICQETGRHALYARLYGDVVQADPIFPKRSPWALRIAAAADSVLAGCGSPGDAVTRSPAELARLRQQGLQWMQDQLALQMSVVQWNDHGGCLGLRSLLVCWQTDAGLASVREPDALGRLPADEQARWRAFWKSLQASMDQLQNAGGAVG